MSPTRRSSSLPGALGSAYQRVDEMLSGYNEIPANVPARAQGQHIGNGSANGNGRRKRNRRHRNGR